jgi:hypothetical protein
MHSNLPLFFAFYVAESSYSDTMKGAQGTKLNERIQTDLCR